MDVGRGFAIFLTLFLKGLLADDPRATDLEKIHQFRTKLLQSLNSSYDSSNNTISNPIVFNFISDAELANVPVQEFVTQFTHFNENVNFVTKVLQTLKNDQQRFNFLSRLPDDYSNTNILRMLAQDLVKKSPNDETSLDLLLRNRWLLLSAPPSFLLKLNRVHKVFLLLYFSYMAPMLNENKFWNRQSQLTKRTWSKIVLEPESVFLYKLDNFPYIFEGANLDEIKSFFNKGDEKLSRLQMVQWSTYQIRKILESLANDTIADEFIAVYLPQLLPKYAPCLLKKALSKSKLPNCVQTFDDISLSMALQLFEYVKTSYRNHSYMFSDSTENTSKLVEELLRSQFYKKQISNQRIDKHFNSETYSFLARKSSIGNSWNLKGSLAAIPASFFINYTKKFSVRSDADLSHVFQFSPQGNKMRALAVSQLYNKTEPEDFKTYFKNSLKSTNNEFVSLISPFEISRNPTTVLKYFRKALKNDTKFARRIANLPGYVLTELWHQRDTVTYESIFDDSYPIYLAILGLDCNTVAKIPTSDFLSILEFYNTQRELYSKPFPKDLQKCVQTGFLAHLKLKSEVSSGKVDENLAKYLDLVEIRSIGGYVLATLPTSIILESKFCDNIVEEIGRLSLPELMLAVPKYHLDDVTSEFLEKKVGEGEIQVEHLLSLGNLVHFTNETYLKKIQPAALKFALEANVFDTRICASSNLRKVWANLLIRAYGSVETWHEDAVLKVGDMLITLVSENTSLNEIKSSVWSTVADLVTSKYMEDIEWIARPLPFYEACSVVLFNKAEVEFYKSSIEQLTLFYAKSIEHQLNRINDSLLEYIKENSVFWETTTTNAIPLSTNRETESNQFVSNVTSSVTTTESFHTQSVITSKPTISEFAYTDDKDVKRTTTNVRPRGVENHPVYRTESTIEASQPTQDPSSKNFPGYDVIVKLMSPWLLTTMESKENSTSEKKELVTPTVTYTDTFNLTVTSKINFDQLTTNSTSENNHHFETSSSVFNSTVDSLKTISHSTTEAIIKKEEFSLQTSTFPSTVAQRMNNTNDSFTPVSSTRSYVTDGTTEYQLNSSNSSGASFVSTSNFSSAKNSWSEYLPNTTLSLDSNVSTDRITVATEYTTRPDVTTASSVFSDSVTLIPAGSSSERETRSANFYTQSIESMTITPKEIHEKIIRNILRRIPDSTFRQKRQTNVNDSPQNISCNTLKILGPMSNFVLKSVEISDTEAFDCIELLGEMDLDEKRKRQIWSVVDARMNEANLKFVAGKILTALSKSDYKQFTFDVHSDWALELINAISENLEDSTLQLNIGELEKIIFQENIRSNDKKNIPFIATITVALGKMICELPNSTLDKILRADDKFSNIWMVFHSLTDCPMTCLERIADEVEKQFGKPLEWPSSVFAMIGPVAAAVRDIRENVTYAPYLHKSAIERLASELKSDLFDEKIITKMPFSSALILLQKQGANASKLQSLTEIMLKEEVFRKKDVQMFTSNGNRLLLNVFLFASLMFRFVV